MYEDRIAKGAEFLDNHFGEEDWRAKIDLDKLDMANSFDCVLGQLFRSFWNGCALLALNPQDTRSMAFLTNPRDPYAYETLTREWKKYLQENPVK